MKINEYYKAQSLDEAYEILLDNEKNIIIGGGAWLKLTKKDVETAVDITKIGLNEIIATKDFIEIGAMTSLRQIEESDIIKNQSNGILSEAISQIMGVGIRNIATIGGSVMGKYAFSDILTPLLTMDASLIFYKQGEMSLADFLNTKRISKDILTKIVIPKNEKKGFFYKVQKTRLDFAVINVAVTKGELIDIAIGARPSVSMRPVQALEFINNQKSITDEVINKTAELAVKETKFGTNSRSSKEYREMVTEVYIKRGLKEVISNES